MNILKTLALVPAAAIAIVACLPAQGAAVQNYPQKAVRFIVPFPPGGSADTFARPLGQRLSDVWKQQVIIDNRPGASGMIGTGIAAKAPADGYTLLMASGGPLTINPGLYSKLPYDPVKDFSPITIVAAVPNVLAVHPSLPVRTVKELIALAKARPGAIDFTSTGNASPGHLGGELFKAMTGTDMRHIPYKGSAASVTAILSGEVSVVFTTTPAVLPLARANRVRILAVTTRDRLPELPDVPTVEEAGLKGYEAVSWFGVVAPAGTAADIIEKNSQDMVRILKTQEMRALIAGHGAVTIANSPAEFAKQIRADTEKWARLIKALNVKAD